VSDERRTHGGISVKTLLIAAAASATAAFVIPMIWRPGTVFAAAMTPVIVTLVSEMLRRPVDTVSAVRVRRTPRGTAILDPPPEEPFDPLAPASAEELAVLPEPRGAPPPEHRRRPLTAREWKLGLATGLVVFAVVALVLTGTELIAGSSVSSGGGRTTFLGGSSDSNAKKQRERDKQEQAPQDEQRKSEQATPEPTPSTTAEPAPTTTATPAPTVSPTATPGAPAEPTATP
jgi:hypothetical protein